MKYMNYRVSYQKKIFDLTQLTFIMAVPGSIELKNRKRFFELYGPMNNHDKS